MNMRKLEYEVRFVTPAFLGNAEQNGQWRTPPFKALLRQWWRVVHGPKVSYDVTRLHHDEAMLFGAASDDKDVASGKSRVRLRLDSWDPGSMKEWQACGTVHHPEVGQAGKPIGADLYLGYGPLGPEGGKGTVLGTIKGTDAKRTAIEALRASARLRLSCPEDSEDELKRTMQFIAWFGTLGSRSRNGWGSLTIDGEGLAPLSRDALDGYARPIAQCLQLDWPHAVGADNNGPLIWKTASPSAWKDVIKELARIKIALRTALPLNAGHGPFQDRHLLSYPVTNHTVTVWGQKRRLANQLRFKVAIADDQSIGLIVHLPCALPRELSERLGPIAPNSMSQSQVWQRVHSVLDAPTNRLVRL
ncbi:MAG: hypothetical protein HY650_02295 [Acidobacteria bacterium]|nr:hypothetical protein [Acidobacteriota bacterium]